MLKKLKSNIRKATRKVESVKDEINTNLAEAKVKEWESNSSDSSLLKDEEMQVLNAGLKAGQLSLANKIIKKIRLERKLQAESTSIIEEIRLLRLEIDKETDMLS